MIWCAPEFRRMAGLATSPGRLCSWLAGACLAGVVLFGPVPGEAQDIAKRFGGFAADPNAPIDIEADRLDVDDNRKTAVFSGNVRARQGTFMLRSKRLEITYAGSAADRAGAKPAGGGSTEVVRLFAKGGVFASSVRQETQTAKGQWADFDVRNQVITMGDAVDLTQGRNVIRGGKLVIDLKTGRSSFLSSPKTVASGSKRRRVRMLITPDGKIKAAPAGDRSATGRDRSKTSASTVVRQ